jgi:hypothetical protein
MNVHRYLCPDLISWQWIELSLVITYVYECFVDD